MRLLPLERIHEEHVLGCNIYDANQRLLLREGVQITASNKARLIEGGYMSVYVQDRYCRTKPKPLLTDQMRNDFIGIVKKAFQTFNEIMNLKQEPQSTSDSFKLKKLMKTRDDQLEQVIRMTDALLDYIVDNQLEHLEFILPKNIYLYPYQHAIQTGILCILIGRQMGQNYNALKSLFIASILCEMGNLTIPKQILLKRGVLSSKEFDIVKKHCYNSYQEVGACSELNYVIKLICLEHHERMDGSGYPNNLKGEDINILARILAVADSFDALISDRPYRLALSSYSAVETIEKDSGRLYDKNCVSGLKTVIHTLPVGTYVKLNQKITGVVIQHHAELPDKPVIRLIDKAYEMQTVDMARHPELKITGIHED